jgi:FKBP-type peptidyl-prolyl cis-trans isomerase
MAEQLASHAMKLHFLLIGVASLAMVSTNAFAESALERGKKFLEENGKKEGVKTTSSGLQYKILKEGAGRSPKASDTVVVHYKGTLINGKEFDSSYQRGEPATFPLSGVIKGWTEGLLYLREGGKAMLYIPSELAYGSRGAGADIGPNETLIFEVELVKIQ